MSQELSRQIGELSGMLAEVKKNTDRIPDALIQLALHETRLDDITPKVDRHERTAQRATGMAALVGAIVAFLTGLWHNG